MKDNTKVEGLNPRAALTERGSLEVVEVPTVGDERSGSLEVMEVPIVGVEIGPLEVMEVSIVGEVAVAVGELATVGDLALVVGFVAIAVGEAAIVGDFAVVGFVAIAVGEVAMVGDLAVVGFVAVPGGCTGGSLPEGTLEVPYGYQLSLLHVLK